MVPLVVPAGTRAVPRHRREVSAVVGTFIVAAALLFGMVLCVGKVCSRYVQPPSVSETPAEPDKPEPFWEEIT